MAIVTNPYPIFSWQINESYSLDVTANNITETIAVAPSSTWGFAVDTSGMPSSNSIMGLWAAALLTHTQISAAVASHVWTLPGWPGGHVAITKLGDNAGDELEFSAGDAELRPLLGVQSGTDPSIAGSTSVTWDSDWCSQGYWSPNIPTGYSRREAWPMVRASITSSPFDRTAYSHTVWSEDESLQALIWTLDRVDATYLAERYSADPTYCGISGRDAEDPNNLLSHLLRAMVSGKTIRVYLAAGVYISFAFVDQQIRSVDAMATRSGHSGRLYTVVIPGLLQSIVDAAGTYYARA